MLFKAILLRRQAGLTADPTQRARITGEAAELQGKAMALRRTQNGMPPPPPPPPPSGGGTTSEMVFVPAPSASGAFEPPRTSALNPLRIGGNIKSPAKIYDVRPVYPPIALQARVTGVVILEVVIDADGNVAEGWVLRSIPLLDQAALDAVKEWKYRPTLLNGTPVPVIMTVAVNFNLQ
jgi:protein TonB